MTDVMPPVDHFTHQNKLSSLRKLTNSITKTGFSKLIKNKNTLPNKLTFFQRNKNWFLPKKKQKNKHFKSVPGHVKNTNWKELNKLLGYCSKGVIFVDFSESSKDLQKKVLQRVVKKSSQMNFMKTMDFGVSLKELTCFWIKCGFIRLLHHHQSVLL